MMITLRPAHERGHANYGWLDTWHSFSFANYYDPQHMGWGSLRVINDDTIAGGDGFNTHPHQNMEILSYVLQGALQHRDTMGTSTVIRPGEVQLMSAGSGIAHSEFNHSPSEPAHFLQIWIQPQVNGLQPGYQQIEFPDAEKRGQLRLIASGDGANGSVKLGQDARVYAALLDGGEVIEHRCHPKRHLYAYLAHGSLCLNGMTLQTGDGAKIIEEELLRFDRGRDAEVLLFDMA